MANKKKLPGTALCSFVMLAGAFGGNPFRRLLYRSLLGYRIDSTASIGISFIRVREASLGPGSRIGHFSIIRNLDILELNKNAKIGTFNWIFGMFGVTKHFIEEVNRKSLLILEHESSVTSRHILDCTDSITIGAFATVAGFKSQILTHGIDIRNSRQSCAPVHIGPYSMIGSGCIILKGSCLPEGSILSAGSCFNGKPTETHQLWSGIPARQVKPLNPNLVYFRRDIGSIS